MIREVWEHTEKRRTGEAAMSQEGRMEEESEEEVGKGGRSHLAQARSLAQGRRGSCELAACAVMPRG